MDARQAHVAAVCPVQAESAYVEGVAPVAVHALAVPLTATTLPYRLRSQREVALRC